MNYSAMIQDVYKGRRITFTSGPKKGQWTIIEESEGTMPTTKLKLRNGMKVEKGDSFIIT